MNRRIRRFLPRAFRRHLLHAIATLIIVGTAITTQKRTLNAEETPANSRVPNIVFILADDIGYEALNCYGGEDFKTPHLNAMAAGGLRFARAYTSPVCTPSRVSMHTGLYTTRHGHTGVLPVHQGTRKKVAFDKMPTYAQLLRASGYATSVTGKWQLATLEHWPDHIRQAGFDSWCVWQIWRTNPTTGVGGKTDRYWKPTINHDGALRDDVADRFGPDVMADYVIDQMKAAQQAGKPFLIVHNELLPHDPLTQTPDDRELGHKASLGGMIHYMDHLVGKLLRAVEELGIQENTYVVFMGDNGTQPKSFHNPRHGQPGEKLHTRHTARGNVNGGKTNLNDAGTHVPLIIWGPNVPSGQTCDELIDVVDLFPTFCELSATPIPDSIRIDGRSFAPQIHGKPGATRAWTHQGYTTDESVFDGQWRLTRKAGTFTDARELPAERPAATDDPRAESVRSRLQAILNSIRKDGPRPPEPVLKH